MTLEVEQKFRLINPPAISDRLGRMGAEFGPPEVQVDSYFAHPTRNFAATDEALRIRRVGCRVCVTYKGPKIDTTTKTRREIEIPLPDGDAGEGQFSELLAALGFTPVAQVHKRRRKTTLTWAHRELEIALDDVQGLGDFIELEILAEPSQLEEAKACLASLANELQLANPERRGYLDLLLRGSGPEK